MSGNTKGKRVRAVNWGVSPFQVKIGVDTVHKAISASLIPQTIMKPT
jgi:hypothetical protein